MPLDTATLKVDLQTLFDELATYDGSAGKTTADAKTKFKDDMAAAIEKFVKTGSVTVTGITAGAATAPGTIL